MTSAVEADPAYADAIRNFLAATPLGRAGQPEDQADAVMFLLSPAASFISGTVLRIDGARPQARPGWEPPPGDPSARMRDAVRPFDGFHRAVTPKVFSV